MRLTRLLLATATTAAIAAGCSGDDASEVTLVEGIEARVSSIDNTFRPETLEVLAGTEVRWTNDGRNEHNVLPVEGDDWGVQVDDFAPGDEYVHRFTEPGTYAYYCSLHGTTTKGMIGAIVVTAG